MKWFKHYSDASQDEKLVALEAEFGLEGYARYWKILEIIASQMGADNGKCSVTYPTKLWCRYLTVRTKILDRYLLHSENLSLMFSVTENDLLTISVPKLLEIRDNHSRNLQAKKPQLASKIKSKSKSKIKNKKNLYSEEFESFWLAYPKKTGKGQAWVAWQNQEANRPENGDILKAVEEQKLSDQWLRDGGQYIPLPSTWLNQGRWDDRPVEVNDDW